MSNLNVRGKESRCAVSPKTRGMRLEPDKTTIQAAAELLGHLGSDQDPIYFRGKETTAADLAAQIPETKITTIRIGYFGRRQGRLCRVHNGTFAAMIKDRGGAEKAHTNAKGWLRHAHLAGDSPDYCPCH